MIDIQRGILYLDVDGVIADLQGSIVERVNHRKGTNWTAEDIQGWGWEPVIPEDENWWDYTHDWGFWAKLPLYPWSKDLVTAALQSGMPLAFLSALPLTPPEILYARRSWLDENFKCPQMARPSKRLVCAEMKDLVVHRGDLLIDDREDNLTDVRHRGAEAWCFEQPWNADAGGRMDAYQIIANLQELGASRRDAESDR